MKKLSFLIIIIAAVFVSCAKQSLQLDAVISDSSYDGQTVYIAHLVERQYVPFDSAVVAGDKFSYVATADSAFVAYLVIDAVQSMVVPFVVEKGKLKLVIDLNAQLFKLSGTPQNMVLQQFLDEESRIWAQLSEYKKVLDADSVKTVSEKSHLYSELDEKLTVEYTDFSFKLIQKNINTAAGTYVFLNSYYYFTVAQKSELFDQMNVAVKNNAKMQQIIAATELEKRLSAGADYVDFKQLTPAGDSLALSDLVGKTDFVLIDFWASWCGPCIASIPELKELYAKYGGHELEIVGVSLDRTADAWKNAIKKYGLNWHHVSDLQYWNSAPAKLYAVNSIPSTYLIDKYGKIVASKTSLKEVESIILQKK